jgi:uncharacterized protein involved in outer membrane biogenesis
MFKLIKRLFKWLLYLFIIVVVLIVAAVLLLDTIVKQVVQSRLRSETGMEVKIGKMDIGLATPTIAVEDLKIYNPPEFGGSLFLSLPEIYVDYDRAAIRAGKLHLNLVRINLAEIDVVQDNKGRVNLQSVGAKSQAVEEEVKKRSSSFTFTGLDTLNVTFQKMRRWSLDSPARVEEVNFGISNEVFTNLKTEADLQRMAAMLAARSSASASPSSNAPVDMAKILQQLFPPKSKTLNYQ